ncbi:MAG TPA: MFS transporter [Thermomicrobiales bacterium]|nr:MFS transporter [Thermomicrobiales bacterium]
MSAHDLPQRVELARGGAAPYTARRHLTLSLLWFALNFQAAAILPIVLPVQILLFVTPGAVGDAGQATLLGWYGALAGVLALALPPLVGALSDQTRGPWGRRRPYIALGAAVEAVGAWALAGPRSAAALLAGLLVFQVGSSVALGGYQGLLPDLVPAGRRGEASGYLGLMTILGTVGSLGLAALLLQAVDAGALSADVIGTGAARYYLATTVALALGTLVTLAGVRETPLTAVAGRAAVGRRARFAAAWLAPWRHRNFTWVFLTRCAVILGQTLFMTFIAYYFASVVGAADFVRQTAALALLALLGAATSALGLGVLSDRLRARIGRAPLVCGATACMALAALAFVARPGALPLWPLGLLFGVGFGAYSSVDWALAVDALPSAATAGKDMGLWSMASALPAGLGPFLGAVVLHQAGQAGRLALGYRVVFALAVAALVAGAACILFVRNEQAPDPADSEVRAGWRLAGGSGGGRARGFLRFWPLWERLMHRVHHTRPIPGGPSGVLSVEFTRYHGRPIVLRDGTPVEPGDPIVALHVNNDALARAVQGIRPWQIPGLFKADLRALARWAATPDFPADVRALHGVTLLGRPSELLGFSTRPCPPTLATRLTGFFMTGLMVIYHPQGLRRLTQGAAYGSLPEEVWMSRGELQRRYGGGRGA